MTKGGVYLGEAAPPPQIVVCSADERMLAMSPAQAAPAVRFGATLYAIDGPAILRLPEKAGNQLPSRGQVAVQAAVNGHACQTPSNRTASPATGCGSTRSNSGPLRSAPGTPRKSSSRAVEGPEARVQHPARQRYRARR